MWQEIKDNVKSWWDGVWGWCKNSGTILLARLEIVVGFVISAVSMMDWSPLLSMGIDTGFSWAQAAWIGGVSMVHGLVAEITRRRGTKEVAGHLIPTADTLKTEELKVVVKPTKTKKKKKAQ